MNGMNGWVQAVRKAGKQAKINKELVEELVDRVMVFEDKRVEIVFRFVEKREELERLIAEIVEAEEPEVSESEAEGLGSSESISEAGYEEGVSSADSLEEDDTGSSGWV